VRRSSVAALAAYVERGRVTNDELRALVGQARGHRGGSLASRPWVAVSMPGAVVQQLGDDVVLGVPRGYMDDEVLRTIAARCPDVWVDGRWYPADVTGYHLVLTTTLTVVAPAGLASEVAALMDVPADERRFVHDTATGHVQFARLAWRPVRTPSPVSA